MKKNLFDTARLKLTGFYLAIIMTISLAFSGIIYRGVGLVFSQRMQIIEKRMRRINPVHEVSFVQDVEEVRKRVLLVLGYTNAGILVFSGVGGYWLAGRTLKPIKQAMEDQKRFVADAAHELRTPLTVLKTSIEVALRDKEEKNYKNILQSNLEEVNSVQKLTDNLLSLAKYQDNGNQLTLKKADLKKLIEQVYKKLKPLAEEKNIQVEFDLDEVQAGVDSDSIEKVIMILLDNAIKYTPKKGKVKVTLYSQNKQAVVEISDTGVGISDKDLPYIFDRFYRADSSRTNDGFGLGLSLAEKIVDLHQGTIKVDSEFDQGTTFTIKLPKNSS